MIISSSATFSSPCKNSFVPHIFMYQLQTFRCECDKLLFFSRDFLNHENNIWIIFYFTKMSSFQLMKLRLVFCTSDHSHLRNCINQFDDRYSNRENKEECFPRVILAETLAASLNLTIHYTPNYLKAITNPMGYILPHAYMWKYNYESANSVHTLGISGARLIYCPIGGGGFHKLLT